MKNKRWCDIYLLRYIKKTTFKRKVTYLDVATFELKWISTICYQYVISNVLSMLK